MNSDMKTDGWLGQVTPKAIRPYGQLMRLDRPIGSWLLLLPCWWSLSMAQDDFLLKPWLYALFALGAVVMRGAGCTYNDLVDRDFDARVVRTRSRPLASGEVSPEAAKAFIIALLSIGLLILLQFNRFTVLLGAASLVLIALYPFMKRFTYWPQAFLGLTFNWGALMGWAAVSGRIDPPALALYAAGLFWTLGYDTIYAHQDKEDDLIIGVKSTALRLGENSRSWIYGFYGAAIALIALSGFLAALSWGFFALLLVAAAQLIWQAKTVDLDDPQDCLRKFKSNRDFGLILLLAVMFGH